MDPHNDFLLEPNSYHMSIAHHLTVIGTCEFSPISYHCTKISTPYTRTFFLKIYTFPSWVRKNAATKMKLVGK